MTVNSASCLESSPSWVLMSCLPVVSKHLHCLPQLWSKLPATLVMLSQHHTSLMTDAAGKLEDKHKALVQEVSVAIGWCGMLLSCTASIRQAAVMQPIPVTKLYCRRNTHCSSFANQPAQHPLHSARVASMGCPRSVQTDSMQNSGCHRSGGRGRSSETIL